LRINRQKRENSERKPTAVTVVSAIPGSFIWMKLFLSWQGKNKRKKQIWQSEM
jgi:hypothetical protein